MGTRNNFEPKCLSKSCAHAKKRRNWRGQAIPLEEQHGLWMTSTQIWNCVMLASIMKRFGVWTCYKCGPRGGIWEENIKLLDQKAKGTFSSYKLFCLPKLYEIIYVHSINNGKYSIIFLWGWSTQCTKLIGPSMHMTTHSCKWRKLPYSYYKHM